MSTDPGFAIRPSTETDLTTVQAIYTDHVLNGVASFDETPPSLDDIVARRAEVTAAELPHIVAVVDGTVAGFAYAAPFRSRPAYRYTVEDSVYVAADHQRQGLGLALLARVIEEARGAGRRQMIAAIGDSGNTASIGLHAALGFAHVGIYRDVGFKFGRWLDVVLMQRAL